LTSCGPSPDVPLSTSTSTRFQVTRVGTFKDTGAYDNRRSIYIIVDTKTGKEFVGISGIGISETGSHMVGKVNTEDER
jgi:hypothetical protein